VSEFSRREHLVRVLQDLSVRPDVVAGDRPPEVKIDIYRALLSAIGLVSLGPLLVEAVRGLHVPVCRVAGADLGGYTLATIAALYSFNGAPLAPFEPIAIVGSKVEGAFVTDAAVVLLTDDLSDGEREVGALAALRAAGLRPTGVVSVLDREEGGSNRVLEEVPFACLVTKRELLGD
jgi:orotate phosphoribosyltransferase